MLGNNIRIAGLLMVMIGFIASGCSKAPLTEAQSEVVGYCLFALTKSDNKESIQLFNLIRKHVDERGFNKEGIKKGSLRALEEFKGKSAVKLSDKQISACREILSW